MNNDLISREALRRRMYHEAFETDNGMQKWDSGLWIRYKIFENVIEAEPTADVRENVHAHWEGDGQCSNCKDYPLARYMRNPNFCPNCGARMDEEEPETPEEDWYRDEWRDEWDERRDDE